MEAKLFLTIISVFLTSLSGSIYGVNDNDWIYYQIYSDWKISGEDYSSLVPIEVYIEFEEVLEDEVQAYFTELYTNGSSSSYYVTLNQYDIGNYWLIPSGLEEQSVSGFISVNYTYSDYFFGELREVNVFEQYSNITDQEEFFSLSWDKETGILLDLYYELFSPDEYYYVNYIAVETSLWPLDPMVISSNLSHDSIQKGNDVDVTVDLSDSFGFAVTSAAVSLEIDGRVIDFLDQGNGHYVCSIDTTNLTPGTYNIRLTAKKTGYTEADSSHILEIEEGFPFDTNIILFAAIGALILLVVFLLLRARTRKKPDSMEPVQRTPEIRKPPESQVYSSEEIDNTVPLPVIEPDLTEPIIVEEYKQDSIEEYTVNQIIESYRRLTEEYESGKKSENDYEAEIEKLKFSDGSGTLWILGGESGSWYKFDGEKWMPGSPDGVLRRLT